MASRDPWKGLRGNAVLRSLGPHDALVLGRSIQRVAIKPGDRLTPSETDLIYFPENVVVCQVGRGCNSAIAMIGREGLVGWDWLFHCAQPTPQFFVALTGGSALVTSGPRLRALMARQSSLTVSLVPHLQYFAMQMANTILTTLHGTIEARVCAWLLMMHRRVDGDELRITHGALGEFLSVRRASVTDTMHILEGERALRCGRGRVIVLDPPSLQRRAGSIPLGVGEPMTIGEKAPLAAARRLPQPALLHPTQSLASLA